MEARLGTVGLIKRLGSKVWTVSMATAAVMAYKTSGLRVEWLRRDEDDSSLTNYGRLVVDQDRGLA